MAHRPFDRWSNATAPVLVTGAHGFIGSHLCAELGRREVPFRCAVRRRHKRAPGSESVVVGDIHGETDWRSALDGIRHVVHLAARAHIGHDTRNDSDRAYRTVNIEATAGLGRAAAAAGIPLLHMSTIGVHGSSSEMGAPFVETSPPAPRDAYTRSKWAAEQRLGALQREEGLRLIVLRSPLVYGPRNPGTMARLLSLVLRSVPLPLGSIRNRRSMLYVGNLVDAMLSCLAANATTGRTYMVSDGEDISTPALIRRLAAHLDTGALLFPMPTALLRGAGRLTRRQDEIARLTGSLQVDSSGIREALGWRAPCSLEVGLRRTCEWFMERG